MKKTMMKIGGIGAGVILILIAFTAVVNAQATKTTIQDIISEVQTKETISGRMPLLQQIKALGISDIRDLLSFLFGLFLYLILWFSFRHPPS